MVLRNSFTFALVLFLAILGSAQQPYCLYSAEENYHREVSSLSMRDQVLKIPVVLHFLYDEIEDTISTFQVQLQMNALNRDFRRRGLEWHELPPELQEITADSYIEFFLATTDPQGNPTNGITQTRSQITTITDVYYSNRGGYDAWLPSSYLNVWVTNLPNGVLGFSSEPKDAGSIQDGVVISEQYFGVQSGSEPYNLGRTLVHEVGHYLGLNHIWGNLLDECTEDDGISDTPMQSGPHYDCPSTNLQECEMPPFFWNFMDYTPDCCMAAFTAQQVNLMRDVILNYRSGLLNNQQEEGPFLFLRSAEMFPNPAKDVVVFSWEDRQLNLEKIIFQNVDGKIIRSQAIKEANQPLEYCLEGLPNGLLLVNLVFSDGSKSINKLIHVE